MTYAAVQASKAPSAWWRGNEASGATMIDASGNSRNGIYTGVGYGAPTFGLLTGDTDGAIFYNGSSSYSEIADAAWMDAASPFSIHAVIRPSGVAAANQSILTRYNGTFAQSQFTFRLDTNKVSLYVFIGSGLAVATGATSLIANADVRVGATYDGTNIRVYVNGVLDGSVGSASGINTSSTTMRIGRNSAGSNEYYGGWIDEPAIAVGNVWSERDFGDLNAAALNLERSQPRATRNIAPMRASLR